jgi:AraC-like DNA-binding protein
MLQNTTQNLKSPKLYPASSSLAKECHRLVALAHPQGDAVHRSQVLGIAAAVLSAEFKCARSNHVGFVRMEDHMMQVFEALSPTDLLALPVGDIAHKFSCSRRHLNRLFHQHFGCSVAALRMELRLLKALSLLRNPGLKIISVAEQCGFNHLGLFNACFKKRFGAPPGLLRKRGLDGAKQASDLDAGHPACPLHTQGLCPWLAQEITSTEKLRRSNGPTKDMTARDMLDVSAKLESKSSSGNLVRNAH